MFYILISGICCTCIIWNTCNMPEFGFSLPRISCLRTESPILFLYRNIRGRENPHSSIFYAVSVHARVSNYAFNKDLCNEYRLFNILYNQSILPSWNNGNLFVFNLIDINLKLCSNAPFYIVVYVSCFNNMLVSFIFS